FFSTLGLIGKLWRSEDVRYITYAIALYHKFKPVDWIFYDVEYSRYCSVEQNKTDCTAAREASRVIIAPPLFQHNGRVSSLQGKSQKLKERYFEKHHFKSNRGNPKARITTSMKHYLRHSASAGYCNNGFMWFVDVLPGSYLKIEFLHPTKILGKRKDRMISFNPGILIISGVAKAPLDQFGPETLVFVGYRDGEFRELGSFSEEGDFLARLDGREVSTLELRVTERKERWVIVGYFVIDFLTDRKPPPPPRPEIRRTKREFLSFVKWF
ncbi:hypothetical protein GCK32_009323, partial [Trichostrongylus colubriformis]